VYIRCQSAAIPHWAADEPDLARAELREALALWPGEAFLVQHWCSFFCEIQTLLYGGPGREAWDRVAERWPRIKRSFLLHVQYLRTETMRVRAGAALAAAAALPAGEAPSARETFLRAAERDARRIEGEGRPWTAPHAALIRAGIAAARANVEDAIARLAAAQAGFEAGDMPLFAAAAERRRGALIGGDEGGGLMASADARLAPHGVQNPARLADMLAPGFRGAA
jgi:hypothetical protein